MKEDDLRVFTEAAFQYFSGLGEPAQMGIPFLLDRDFEVLDFTGIIGITGASRGCIYVTASVPLLKQVALAHLGEDGEDPSPDDLTDLIGEMANVISGNARRVFGEHFNISVPVCMEGRPQNIRTMCRLPAFVIPLQWQNHKSFVVVCLD